MSHFSVMIIGGDVEKQLQPFHEFECTGENDQFVQDVDVTEECRENGLDYHGLEDKTVTNEADIDKEGEHKYGYAIVDAEGNLIKAVNRTNPNKKWDWWVIGGRWGGFLQLKPEAIGVLVQREYRGINVTENNTESIGGRADIARKGDIDFEAMRNEAGFKAASDWDKAYAIHKGESWEPWSVVGPRTGYDDVARETYRNQAAVQALRQVFDNPFHDIDRYLTPRDKFIQQARDRATVPYALVKDSQWLGKGEMGWFGMSSGDMDQDDWNRKVNEMLDGLPDETVITMVDCHI